MLAAGGGERGADAGRGADQGAVSGAGPDGGGRYTAVGEPSLEGRVSAPRPAPTLVAVSDRPVGRDTGLSRRGAASPSPPGGQTDGRVAVTARRPPRCSRRRITLAGRRAEPSRFGGPKSRGSRPRCWLPLRCAKPAGPGDGLRPRCAMRP